MNLNQISSDLECHVSLEHVDHGQSLSKKVNFKKSKLRLLRNEARDIFLCIMEKDKQIVKQELKNVSVHNKFLTEGKATIKFNNLSVFISNAPCSELFSFLKLMSIKMISNDCVGGNALTKLMNNKSSSLQDISPLNEKEYEKARMKMKNKNAMRQTLENRSDIKAKRNCLLQAMRQSLSKEQMEIVEAAKEGHNIFFTGSAGTGKSFVLKNIIAAFPPDVTFATASTAVAACQIGGTTLHQFAGVGKGEASIEHLVSLANRPSIQAIWKKCCHLIIDEISMVHGEYFEKLECVARKVRQNEKPFGGIQLILCGDFFQLPPVGNPVVFCFQTKAWDKCITKMFELKEIHRQSDPVLIDILQSIRLGRVSEKAKRLIEKTATQSVEKHGILPTRLCTHTAEAASINEMKLKKLEGEVKVFRASDSPKSFTGLIDQLSRVSSKLNLKVGAQVMLMKNINVNEGLVNGARGVVLKFDNNNLPIVQFSCVVHTVKPEKFISKTSSGVILTRVQIPLSLAWAFSIHKSQGLTLDCIELSLARVFEAGHSYVALSRVKTLDCVRVLDFSPSQVWANPHVLNYYHKFKKNISFQ